LQKQGKLDQAEAVLQSLLGPMRARLPAGDPRLAGPLAQLTYILISQKKFTEAEPLARESLEIREKQIPDDWRTFNNRSMLGECLLAQKSYPEAEPLLLAGYEGMKQREAKLPAAGKSRLKETAQRLIELYEAVGNDGQAAEWKKKLEDLDQARDAKTAAAASPTGSLR
jgi:hypothetical protein